MTGKINKWTLFRVALRSHFIMSAWNFQRMLNIGFLNSASPAFKKLYPSDEGRKSVLLRHMKFFNAHPYFVSYVLGLVIKKEEQMAKNLDKGDTQSIQPQMIESMKSMYMGPLGALGDSFFWSTLRPFFGLMAVIISVGFYSISHLFFVAPLVFFVLYNIFHEYVRISGIFIGYYKGEETIKYIQQLNLQKAISIIQNLGIVLAGGLLGLFVFLDPVSFQVLAKKSNVIIGIHLLVLLGITGLFYYGLHKKMTTTRMFFGGLVILWFIDLVSRGV